MHELLTKVSLDYTKFMDKHVQGLFPVDCEDKIQFIKDHQIHMRTHTLLGIKELWMDDRKIGTFSQRYVDRNFIFEFTK